LNRTWRFLSLSGSLRLFMASTDCSIRHLDAHYSGNVGKNKSRILLSSFSIYQYSSSSL
jgi:hypothetical protein